MDDISDSLEEWRLKPGFVHYMPKGKSNLKPGDILESTERRMTNGNMLERFDRVGPAPENKDEDKDPSVKLELESLGRGWYNVLNVKTGKPINSVKLRHSDAKALIDDGEED